MPKKLIEEIFEIKKLILKSLFADDELMEIFVLKGGNALDIAYKMHNRSSMDMDVSMDKDFNDYNLEVESVKKKLEIAFEKIFINTDYTAFDFNIIIKPRNRDEGSNKTWGGYCLEFKVIESKIFDLENLELTRKQAIPLGKHDSRKFTVDISRFEYTEPKEEIEFENMNIFVYSPLMIVNEKLRAICQQMDEYTISKTKKQRARDFFDIHLILETLPKFKEEFYSEKNKVILTEIFNVKEVPLNLLNNIDKTYDYHEIGYSALESTVSGNLQPFKFYFDYVINLVKKLNSFWEK